MHKYMFLYTETDKGITDKYYLDGFGIDSSKWKLIKAVEGLNGKALGKKDTKKELDALFAIPAVQQYEVIVTNNSSYFKELAGVTKTEAYIGVVKDCTYSDAKVIYVPAIGSVLYAPTKYTKLLHTGIETIKGVLDGTLQNKVVQVLTQYANPRNFKNIKKTIQMLSRIEDPTAIDIEAYSLDFVKAGLGTISFSFNSHSAIVIPVDHCDSHKGRRRTNRKVKELLKEYFIKSKDIKHIYHNISYDTKVLIYNLFMKDITDRKGMLEGVNTLLNNWDDTRTMAYLCYNSVDRPDLSLKYQAMDYAGNWAELVGEDIKDISKVESKTLCFYNGIDTGATYFVWDKLRHLIVKEDQVDIYDTMFKPTQVELIKTELTGICIDMPKVIKAEEDLVKEMDDIKSQMFAFKGVAEFNEKLRQEMLDKANSKRKVQRDLSTIPAWVFNPASDAQIREFLYVIMKIPAEHFTDSKQPAVNARAIKAALINPKVSDADKVFLNLLAELSKLAIIVSTFIPAFKGACLGEDGEYYLFGNYNITGTVSGRLSSSNPNLQNIPAHGRLGNLVKSCVKAPPGYIMIGLDADSLEDKISALTTKDPNKLKVYIDGMDGHSFNSLKYFPEQLTSIDPTSVESINSISKLFPDLRQESKPYTFLLTYQGGIGAMCIQFGISKDKATRIYNAYQESYKVSIQWVQSKIDEAREKGYVTCAFGLKLRTPLLKATRFSSSGTRPYAVRQEEKTAGNALGQSYCMLTSRAAIDMGERIEKADMEEDIRLCMLIHDALYYYVKATPEVLEFTNTNLVNCFAWQDSPEIAHDIVKLSGTMSIFYPDWSVETEVSKTSTVKDMVDVLNKIEYNYYG